MISLNPNLYETTPTDFNNLNSIKSSNRTTTTPVCRCLADDSSESSFSTRSTTTTETTSSVLPKNRFCNKCPEATFCGEEFSLVQDTSTSRTCTTCTSNTSYMTCLTCSSMAEEDISSLTIDEDNKLKANVSIDSFAGSSSASETTICATLDNYHSPKRSLLKTSHNAINSQMLISSKSDIREKNNNQIGSSRSTLVASSRPDLTQRFINF